MKKKIIIISIIVFVILFIGIICFTKINDKIDSSITIDINPSFEINLGSNKKVKSIIALNEDAKDVITNDLVGKTLDDSFNVIADNLINMGYIEDNYVCSYSFIFKGKYK